MNNKFPHIILFDGLCYLCNSSVHFIMIRDSKKIFKFSALQSQWAQAFLKQLSFEEPKTDSILYVTENSVYTKSTAALNICRNLRGAWPLLYALMLIPKPLRDSIYDWIAKNRYRWFGKRTECMIPDQEFKSRFLESLD